MGAALPPPPRPACPALGPRAAHAILDSVWLRSWWWIAECDFAPLE